jgi:DNA-binding NtrC family response regulator
VRWESLRNPGDLRIDSRVDASKELSEMVLPSGDSGIGRKRLEPLREIVIGKASGGLAATLGFRAEASEAPVEEQGFVLRNPRMRQVYEEARRAARADLPVLVLGETGVGKEHVALTIHRASARRERPCVVINCAAIAAPLLESTLFGHERGAFTGAVSRSIGVFERAHGGVLFLDEIGELGAAAQAALLRVVETRRVARIGSSVEVPVDVRIVAATHCDLEAMIAEGTFREDLFYRLNGVILEVPPLRERRDEIEPLVALFLAQASRQCGTPRREVTPEAFSMLHAASWPGNVRQLRYAVERAALVARGPRIGLEDWPESIGALPSACAEAIGTDTPILDLSLRQQLRRYERTLIEEALQRAGGKRPVAAKLLRVPLRTLFRRIRACAIVDSNVPAGQR